MTSRYENQDCWRRLYEISIALNNRGVSLLERRCYRDAITALKLSLHLMQSPIKISEDGECMERTTTTREVSKCCDEKLLNAATRILMSPMPTPTPEKDDMFQVVVLSEVAQLNDFNNASSARACNNVAFVFRIELPHEDEQEIGDWTYEFAVFLNNLGAAYSCHHFSRLNKRKKKLTKRKCSNSSLHRAQNCLDASTTLFTQWMVEENDRCDLFKCTLIHMMVLQNSMGVCFHQGQLYKARNYYVQLGYMRENYNNSGESYEWYGQRNQIHAACA